LDVNLLLAEKELEIADLNNKIEFICLEKSEMFLDAEGKIQNLDKSLI
jgi:hypothetical protein